MDSLNKKGSSSYWEKLKLKVKPRYKKGTDVKGYYGTMKGLKRFLTYRRPTP